MADRPYCRCPFPSIVSAIIVNKSSFTAILHFDLGAIYHSNATMRNAFRSGPAMIDQKLDCLTDSDDALPLHTVRPAALETFLASLSEPLRRWLVSTDFAAKAGELRLLPGDAGVAGAVLGLGEDLSPFVFGKLPLELPEGSVWRLASGHHDAHIATIGFCLGSYRYT